MIFEFLNHVVRNEKKKSLNIPRARRQSLIKKKMFNVCIQYWKYLDSPSLMDQNCVKHVVSVVSIYKFKLDF